MSDPATACPGCVLGCVNTQSHSWPLGCIPCPTCQPEREIVTCEFCLGPAPIDQYHPTVHDEGAPMAACDDCITATPQTGHEPDGNGS